MGNCITFDDTDADEYADVVPSDSVLSYPATIAAWMNADSVHLGVAFNWSRSSVGNNQNTLGFFDDGGTLRIRGFLYNGATTTSEPCTASLSTGTWYRAVYVLISATERYLYVNKTKDSFTASRSLYTTTSNPRMSIGRAGDSTPGGYMNGRICDVEVYSEAWDDDDVDWDYDNNSNDWVWNRSGTSITEKDLVGAWLCDEGTGTNLADLSVGENDMTVTAAATIAWDNTQTVFEGKASDIVAVVQSVWDTGGGADPATITITEPIEGNLLIAVVTERSGGSASNHALTGITGWTHQVSETTEQSDGGKRRSFSVFYKVAGASEGTSLTADDGTSNSKWLSFHEFSPSDGEFTFLESAVNDNGTDTNASSLATGTTASVSGLKFLEIGIMIGRLGTVGSADVDATSWTNGLVAQFEQGVTTNAMFHMMGYDGSDVTEEAKSSVCTFDDAFAASNTGCNGAMLVFALKTAASSNVPPTLEGSMLAGGFQTISGGLG